MIHMRQYNKEEAQNVRFLVEKQIEFATMQITPTGLKKSILDATAPVRAYLKEKNLHDYECQLQGPEHKRMVDTVILTETGKYDTKTSMYRPVTKSGDPRLWINRVRNIEFLRADDIFILIVHRGLLYVVNISTVNIREVFESSLHTPLKDLIKEIQSSKISASEELLALIKENMTDWTEAEVFADTGIGRTVESVLGLGMNSSKNPDFKGIELKSHREISRVRNTLFTQSPDWSISRLKSGREIVGEYGYVPEGYDHKSLHVTLRANRPNNQGLGLLIVPQRGILEADELAMSLDEDGLYCKIKDVAAWQLTQLHSRLLTKHRETFWIEVQTRREYGKEYFRVTEIVHTKNPIAPQFDILLDQGEITVDFLLCRNSGGDTYSFKIKSRARQFLFPQSDTYKL